jgi:hypothetical protein
MIIFGVPEEVEDDAIKLEIDSRPDMVAHPVDIVRSFNVHNGRRCVLIDVDEFSNKLFLSRKRVILDMVAYRILNYGRVRICYKCWDYGHLSFECKNKLECTNCDDENEAEHHLKECTKSLKKGEDAWCKHCRNYGHRSDEFKICPVYDELRKRLFNHLANKPAITFIWDFEETLARTAIA